jgi:homoserine kinase type II
MLTATDITRVLSHYTVGTLHSTVSAYSGHVNETAFVQTDQGKFVVRRNHRNQTEAAQRYRHRLLAHLHQHNVPAPVLIPTRDDDTLLQLDGRFYEVMPFVRGEVYHAERPRQQISAGATLAQYHLAVQGFPPPPEVAAPRYYPQNLTAHAEVLVQRDIMGDLADTLNWYDGRAARLRRELPEMKTKQLPHLTIHGDIHADNLLFARDEVVALLDYDQVAWDVRIMDVADALVAFASVDKPAKMHWGVFPGPLNEDRAARLLDGYARVNPLTEQEITALPAVLEILWLQGEMGRVISTQEGAPDYHLSVLDQGLALSYWLNEHRDQLVDRWTDLMRHPGQTDEQIPTAA